ncbi:unnamed protein product [Anisakis simplex]|uniref:Uncharacterized protein n=1 Tax=Anisakis simplex TaxID=6269 RepID=A0A0M3JBC8_ANISI|nr:unnamed protein product [Anisakis simplex]
MAQLGASSSGVEQERVPGVGNGGERFSELIQTFKNDSPESERIGVDECCQLLQACKSNEDYFIAFAIVRRSF